MWCLFGKSKSYRTHEDNYSPRFPGQKDEKLIRKKGGNLEEKKNQCGNSEKNEAYDSSSTPMKFRFYFILSLIYFWTILGSMLIMHIVFLALSL